MADDTFASLFSYLVDFVWDGFRRVGILKPCGKTARLAYLEMGVFRCTSFAVVVQTNCRYSSSCVYSVPHTSSWFSVFV
jgi:hypothetical protein